MQGWKNLQPDHFKDANSVASATNGPHKRTLNTPEIGILDARKRSRLHCDNLAETLPQPELVNSSVSNTGKAPQSSDQRRGDETLQLQGQINLLKELVELKDGQIQEWAVRSKVEETKWREEGSRLVGENAALRNTASALNNDIIRLEHEVEGLKRANDELLNSIAASRKCFVSEGIQAVTSDEISDIGRLKEENKILREENEDFQSKSRIFLQENHALSEDVTRLNIVVKSKNEIISAWEKMGEEWKMKKSGLERDADMLRRESEDRVRRLAEEKQRPHHVEADFASDRENLQTPNSGIESISPSLFHKSVSIMSQNAGALPKQMVNDQPDRDVAMHAMHTAIASRSLSPVDLTSPVLSPDATQPFSKTSTEERLGAMIPAEGASMQSSLNALNCESDRILAPTPGSDGVPLKRKRGRPIGSKNKNPSAAAIRAFLNSGIDVPKRKRGRPPKVKIQPVLNPNDEPMPRRTRGRPPKNCNVNPFQIAQSDLSQPQGSHSVPSNSTNQADIGESNSTEAPFNLRPFESLDPNGDQALHDILQDQLSLAADESVHHVEANASLNQNRDVTSSQPEFGLRDLGTGGMRIKLEHNENPGLTEHHLELIYQTENGKLFCILCARTRVPTPVVSFHHGTSHQKLLEHCNIYHPHESAKFAVMSPERLANIWDRKLSGSLTDNRT